MKQMKVHTMEFDLNGNLLPHTAIEISLNNFHGHFVQNFANTSSRSGIFENYQRYLEDFKREITSEFYQFINGSFVSKKQNPNDLDLVTFIDYRVYEQKESQLEPFKGFLVYEGIDAYIEKIYPPNHRFYTRFHADFLYWNDLFTRNRRGQRKGFIKIIFENEEG